MWLNPSIIPTMAYNGKGPFRRKYPLRALAVFPSWDRLVIAVSPKLGVRTMEELIDKKPEDERVYRGQRLRRFRH